jgi:APA family basic amino acid/polyamine antiporter
VIQTGTIAAVGVAFGKFLGYFFSDISADNWILRVPSFHVGPLVFDQVGLTTQSLAGIVIVFLLTFINVFGVRTGALVQNVFTLAKVGSLALLIIVAIFVGANSTAMAANFGNFWHNAGLGTMHPIEMPGAGIALVSTLVVIAVAQTGSLFSADAWNNVTFTAAEVKNPSRNLPLSLALGTGIVITLYIAANFVYLMVLPLHGDKYGFSDMARGIQYANQDRVGTAVMLQMFEDEASAIASFAG